MNIEREILILILERLRQIDETVRADATSIHGLIRAFESLGPEFEERYKAARTKVEQIQAQHPEVSTGDVTQQLIERLKRDQDPAETPAAPAEKPPGELT